MSQGTVTLSKNNFQETISKANSTVLVDFWAPWCGPCRALSPVLEDIAANPPEGVIIAKLNVDENQDLAEAYEIQSIPSLILFKDGKPVRKLMGAHPKQRILDFLQ